MVSTLIAFLDSSALIYYFEGAPPYRNAVMKALREIKVSNPQAIIAISRLGVMECRVQPLCERNFVLLEHYDAFFKQAQIVELSAAIVDAATYLRASTALKTPDALQAACALSFAEPCTFITGDAGFARVPNLIVCQVAVALA